MTVVRPSRYWFVIFPENKYGPRNIGVTAYSKEHARDIIAKESVKNFYIKELALQISDDTEVIENIDVRNLDQNHVVPNMGTVVFVGIWYPNLNMYGN